MLEWRSFLKNSNTKCGIYLIYHIPVFSVTQRYVTHEYFEV